MGNHYVGGAQSRGQFAILVHLFSHHAALLLQLLAGRPAWEEYETPMQIIFAVAVERRRLPIPTGCPAPIARLLKECWRHNAPLRPSFAEIRSRLRKIKAQDDLLQTQTALAKNPPSNKPSARLLQAKRAPLLP
jgi:hypothetical protein